MQHKLPTLVVVCGSTATGKTDLAFQLAKHLQTEIISFDSVQVYKKFDIGSAKPPATLLAEVKHHLVDELEPGELFTAGDFRRKALGIIEASARSHLVLVGGTGFYLQALVKGMYEIPVVSQQTKEEIKKELQERGKVYLFKELEKIDPAYAKTIHPHDEYRISRALELLRSGINRISVLQKTLTAHTLPHPIIYIGLRRKKHILVEAVVARTEQMLERGLIFETEGLLKESIKGASPFRALDSVGYKETAAYLRGELSRVDLLPQIVKNTLALAKRQMTWFKREESTLWLDSDDMALEAQREFVLQKLTART